MGRFQTNKQMNVIFNSAHSLGNAALVANNPAKVSMKPLAPF